MGGKFLPNNSLEAPLRLIFLMPTILLLLFLIMCSKLRAASSLMHLEKDIQKVLRRTSGLLFLESEDKADATLFFHEI